MPPPTDQPSDLGPRTTDRVPQTADCRPPTSDLEPRTSDLRPPCFAKASPGKPTSDLGSPTSDLLPSPFLSLIIPAHNEEGCIGATVEAIAAAFAREGIADYEIVVVNDNSTDATEARLRELQARHAALRCVNNAPPHGFGYAVRRGLDEFRGEAACIVMADLSDAPEDMVVYYRKLREGWECVFGSRFMRGGSTHDYPRLKYVVNRLANQFIRIVFRLGYEDVTNAFKAYRRNVIEGIQPLLAKHFNLTVEMPLKAIVRGYRYCRVPISWHNRKTGVSKLRIQEMGSRYLFIVLYVWLEKKLSKGDYYRKT